MNDDEQNDYLWDGSGTPDPEVQRLESLLRPLGHRGSAPAVPARGAVEHQPRSNPSHGPTRSNTGSRKRLNLTVCGSVLNRGKLTHYPCRAALLTRDPIDSQAL